MGKSDSTADLRVAAQAAKQAEIERMKTAVLGKLVMARATSQHNTIGMGELYQEVFGEGWTHRINDTRKLRKIITELRSEGVPIASRVSQSGGGYYLPEGSEFVEFCGRYRQRALRILAMVGRFERRTLPEVLGQLVMSCEAGGGDGEKTAG